MVKMILVYKLEGEVEDEDGGALMRSLIGLLSGAGGGCICCIR